MTLTRLSRMWHSLATFLRGAGSYYTKAKTGTRIDSIRFLTMLRVGSVLRLPKSARRFFQMRSAKLWMDSRGYNKMIHIIGKAKFSVYIQIFIWKDDESGRLIAQALLERANRGVRVHVVKETLGDVFEFSEDFHSTKKSNRSVWKAFWNHKNIQVEHRTAHDHSKVIIVDGSTLVLSGMNFADEYRLHWHDYVVELRGTHFVDEFMNLQTSTASNEPIRLITNSTERMTIRPQVMSLLSSAKHSIVAEQAYLSDPAIIKEFVRKSNEGIHITVILPNEPDIHFNANMLSVKTLLQDGNPKRMRIYMYPGMVHGKVLLIDTQRAMVGSVNLITASLDELGETSVVFDKFPKRLLFRLSSALLQDVLKSKAVSETPSISHFRRFLAWLML